jgi:hypothetical protein
MTTVGYGDIVATRQGEYLLILFGMLVGASMFGYVIGTVSELMERADVQASQYQEKLDSVKLFISDRSFPGPLAHRVKEHFEYVYKRTTVFDSTSTDLITDLPAASAIAVAYTQYKSTIAAFTFLKQSPPMFVKEAVEKMKPFHVFIGESITRANDIGLCLLLLETGSATQYLEVSPSIERMEEDMVQQYQKQRKHRRVELLLQEIGLGASAEAAAAAAADQET